MVRCLSDDFGRNLAWQKQLQMLQERYKMTMVRLNIDDDDDRNDHDHGQNHEMEFLFSVLPSGDGMTTL